MCRFSLQKNILLLAFIGAVGIIPSFAQEEAPVRRDIWVCPVFETSFYSLNKLALGGGLALGYGDKVALGLKVIYWTDRNEVRSLELNFLARLYFSIFYRPEAVAPTGPFIQFSGGPVIFAYKSTIDMPAKRGAFSAGLSFGWRFVIAKYFVVEPAIRAGYPYVVGAGLSAGVRF